MTPAPKAMSHLRLAPDIHSIPTRIPANTSDVPRSGWSMTRASGGTTRRQAPRIEPSESRRPWRVAR